MAPGAPVSVLIDYGLSETVVGKLLDSNVGTIEKLGGMTPEELEEIQEIGPEMVEQIQLAVNAYYSQFEDSTPAEEAASPVEEDMQPVEAGAASGEVETAEPETAEPEAEVEEPGGHSGTIESAGSPPNNQADLDGPGLVESTPEEGSH